MLSCMIHPPPLSQVLLKKFQLVQEIPTNLLPMLLIPNQLIFNILGDFDIDSDGLDEDGDTSNDVDATGNPVSFTFENSGSFEVVCTITK